MEALGGGRLTIDERGCIRMEVSEDGPEPTLIFLPDYALGFKDDEVWILDGEDRPVAKVGDLVRVVGGSTGDSLEGFSGLDEQTKRELYERCPGPYWMAGEVRSADRRR
jgi:hypothetical protein